MHAYFIHSVYGITIWWFHHSIQSFVRYFSRTYGCHGKCLTCLNAHAISTVHGLCIKQFPHTICILVWLIFSTCILYFFSVEVLAGGVCQGMILSVCIFSPPVDRVDRAILQPGVSLIKLPHTLPASLCSSLTAHGIWRKMYCLLDFQVVRQQC